MVKMTKKNKGLIWIVVFSLLISMCMVGCNQPVQQAAPAKQILMASTIGPIDAGIVKALEDAYKQKTGITVRHVGAGTGDAIKLAQTGTFDMVLVHAKALEEKFVADGYGTERIDFMYNDFVIVGPADDPAKIKGEKSAAAALKKIAENKSLFISRGDKSGTNVKELEVWEAAGIKPEGDWYKVYEKGASGNVPTLLYTDEQKAYTLMDRATYITTKEKIKLLVLVENDQILLNYITLIPVSQAKFAGINAEGAKAFIDWCVSAEGQKIVKEFGKDKYGEPLFFPNSPEGKKLQ